MAQTLGQNREFAIYNADGTPFHNLVLHKSTFESVVMSLGDKISGDVYYINNTLAVTMQEYIEYKQNPNDPTEQTVKYILVNPPTIVREGRVSENSELKGMTKYSFVFYHPMCLLSNFPFTDVAVDSAQSKYLSQNKTFSWIGTLVDMVAKLNANLIGTEWEIVLNIAHYEQDGVTETAEWQKAQKLSEVLSFDKQYVSDVLKTCYDTWEIPFTVSQYATDDERYAQGKKFKVEFGTPSQEIYDTDGVTPYIFRFGQGVGLKNNSRTPKNNKIVTRIVGCGSENNIPYGYPQIRWYGNQDWDYTINNDSTAANSYPIYKGIVGGQYVKLIKHPFTRTTLMPSIYVQTVFNKVSPYLSGGAANPNYNPATVIVDYYDADGTYPNPINPLSPSVEIHQFEDIKPEFDVNREHGIISAVPTYNDAKERDYTTAETQAHFIAFLESRIAFMSAHVTQPFEIGALTTLRAKIIANVVSYSEKKADGSWAYEMDITGNDKYFFVKYTSAAHNIDTTVLRATPLSQNTIPWDDTMDDNGKYKQSYFNITLPQLDFDLYACASITESMDINMRSGACIGCTFPIEIDWDDYKANFYTSDGDFDPVIGTGHPRNGDKYPDSSAGQITVLVNKDLDTFGVLMPNVYQSPQAGDIFVLLGISLPQTYIDNAQTRLDSTMTEYMLENNVHYYDYPLNFDEHFLATHTNILAQIHNNSVLRFVYGTENLALFVKQMSVKFGESVLPQYSITLADDIEIVLNQIGQVTDDVSRMRVELSEIQKYYNENIAEEINSKLSKIADDVCAGRITFQKGLEAIGSVLFNDEIRSKEFTAGLYDGQGWRIDKLGNAEFESIRARSYLEVIELIINRMQAQEGDTLFTDNDQIDKVDKYVDETDGSVTYVLSLKEKWDGYVTSQMFGNIIKGTINTLAAKNAGVSDIDDTPTTEHDGSNSYFTSWMRVIATHNTDNTLGVNQIRVVLYGDDYIPAQKNFEPCELMAIARWGCIDYAAADRAKYIAEGLTTDAAIDASIKRRQQLFYISTSEGRIVKLNGVDAPILRNGNYGTTIGELPDFVKAYPSVAERLVQGGDYLYAQGVVVGDFIKIDKEGLPVPTVVFCGEWVDGSQIAEPTPQNGIYFYNEYNEDSKQYEIHDVRHNGGRWQCLQHQPVMSGGVATYYEPKWNSPYWLLVDGNDNYSMEFVSTKGSAFYQGHVSTVITPYLYYGNVDISSDIPNAQWSWTRETESGKTAADRVWDAGHTGLKVLSLTDADMPTAWGRDNKAIFTCTVVVNDGKSDIIIQNQVIA